MLFTRECDYGLRIMRNLNTETPVSVSVISEREKISLAMGYKVARKLELAGLICSVRGHTGGYKLTNGLDKVTTYDVYRAIESHVIINECLTPGVDCPLNEDNSCFMHRELARIQDVLINELKRYSLEELANM